MPSSDPAGPLRSGRQPESGEPDGANTAGPASASGPDSAGARAPEASARAPEASEPAPARGYARMRTAEDAARAELEPLRAGERPLAIKLAAALAAAIALGNIALLAGGWQLSGGQQPDLLQSLALPVFMLVCAVAMWQRRYWALVAFQAILAVTIILAFLFLLRASNLEAVLLCSGVLAVSGTLFWFLVRAMARVQMPRDASR